MKKMLRYASWVSFFMALLFSHSALSGAPLFTLTPLTATTIQLRTGDSVTVQYHVQNQSTKPHTIIMVPITSITQVTSGGNCPNPFVLGSQQSCTLNLSVNGSQVGSGVHGGPVLCQQGANGQPSPELCYQPSLSNLLNISVVAPITITSSAGANGSLSPSGSQTLNVTGSSLLFTATPNATFVVYQWLVDGVVAQTGGTTFLLTNITANHNVQVTFSNSSVFYSGTQSGAVYYSYSSGGTWSATPSIPANGSAINSVFVTTSALYVGAANGNVYSSTNNGSSWSQAGSPDGSSVNSVFVTSNMLYAGTANGFVYHSANNGNSWTITNAPDGSAVNAIFVSGNTLYAGTANGNVYYSTNNGISWIAIDGMPDGSAIKSVFVANNTLFVNTANEYAYSSTSLTGGGSWTSFAQTVYSLYVTASGTEYSGTQGGYVYSLTAGTELGFVTYSPINSVFVLIPS